MRSLTKVETALSTFVLYQLEGLEHVVVTAGTGVPASGLVLGVDRRAIPGRAQWLIPEGSPPAGYEPALGSARWRFPKTKAKP